MMGRPSVLFRPAFVEFIPAMLEPEVLYVSMAYGTVVHLCPCGCEEEVVTPLGRDDWLLLFDGETVSLRPSIGNWNFACRSHYWIIRNCVRWARTWTDGEIVASRARATGEQSGNIGRLFRPRNRWRRRSH